MSEFVVTAEAPVGHVSRPAWEGPATIGALRAHAFPPAVARVDWSPLRGVGRIEIRGRSLVYHRTRVRSWSRTLARETTFDPKHTRVEECGPAQWTETSPVLSALLVRVVLRDATSGAAVLAVAVRARRRLLDVLEQRGWDVRRHGAAEVRSEGARR